MKPVMHNGQQRGVARNWSQAAPLCGYKDYEALSLAAIQGAVGFDEGPNGFFVVDGRKGFDGCANCG